jgi:hypothetical protein
MPDAPKIRPISFPYCFFTRLRSYFRDFAGVGPSGVGRRWSMAVSTSWKSSMALRGSFAAAAERMQHCQRKGEAAFGNNVYGESREKIISDVNG